MGGVVQNYRKSTTPITPAEIIPTNNPTLALSVINPNIAPKSNATIIKTNTAIIPSVHPHYIIKTFHAF